MALRLLTRVRTLQVRFLAALTLIGILPLGLVGVGMATLNRQTLAEQSARELTGLARGLAGQLEVYLTGLLHNARAVAALPEIVSMDPARQDGLLKELFHQYPQFARLATFDRFGEPLASSHPNPAFSMDQRHAFQTAARRGYQTWEVGTWFLTGRWLFVVNTPIRDAGRRVVGVLAAVVDLEDLSTVVARVPVGSGGKAFVLDAAGRILLHPDRAAIQERRNYSWLGVPTESNLAAPGTVRYTLEGESLVAGYARVPNIGWTVVVERPEALVLAPAERSWQLALGGLLASSFLAVMTAIVLARTLTRPVRELAVAAHAFGAGDPTASLPALAPAEGELATLVDAFARMREAVVGREQTLARRTRRLEAIRATTAEVTRELDLTTLLGLISQRVMELVGVVGSAVYLWDEAEQALIPQARHGYSEWMGEARVKLGQWVTGRVAQCREGMIVDDYRTWPYANPLFLERTGVTAVLAEPLLYHGRLLGVITLHNAGTEQGFTMEDRDLVSLFAAQAATAIANAQLYASQQSRIIRLQALTHLNQLISSSLDMDAVLQEITKAAASLIAAPLVRIWIADEATQTLEMRASSDEQLDADNPLRKMRFGERVSGWVALHRQPLHIPDVQADERTRPTLDWLQAYDFNSTFGIPIIHQDLLLGVLILIGHKPFRFSPDDQDLLASFVAQAAFPLLLLDADMPEMDGFALAARIAQEPALAGATIMLLTSTDHPRDAARCRALGVAAYRRKPITQSELWEAILQVLGTRPQEAEPLPQAPHTLPERQRHLHILLAEDNAVNQRHVVRLLEKQGHTIVVAGNGREALAALTQQRFDIVLMDVQMPEMDGWEATAAIRAQERCAGGHLPIVALTAHAMKGDRDRCLAAGMDAYVAKPLTAEELYATIAQVLQGQADRSPPSDEPPLSLAQALAAVEGDRALLAELVEVFLHDSPACVAGLREAIREGGASDLERTAHRLKGALGTLGAMRAHDLAYTLETLGREARLAEASSVLQGLEHELERVIVCFADPAWREGSAR
ncbi:MAG: response regulator [Nitrospinae bacterium]|nr:response regulator [Nitrospinota bacterium]